MADVFLVQQDDGESLCSWLLKPGLQTVGREAHCEIMIDDGTISREHAQLIVDGHLIRLIDLESRNGTLVDGTRVQSALVRTSSVLQFGRIVCTFSHQSISANPHRDPPSTLPCESPAMIPNIEHLSERKKRVLQLLLDGMSEKEVATKLELSPNTVHHHVTGLYRTFKVSSRGELLALFVRK